MAAAVLISDRRCNICKKIVHCNYDYLTNCRKCDEINKCVSSPLSTHCYNGEIRKCKFPNCKNLRKKSKGICQWHHGYVYFSRKIDPFFTEYGDLEYKYTSYDRSLRYFDLPDLCYKKYKVFHNSIVIVGAFLCISDTIIVSTQLKGAYAHRNEYVLYEQITPEIYHKGVTAHIDSMMQWLLVGGNVDFLRVSDSYIGVLPKDIVDMINKFTWL